MVAANRCRTTVDSVTSPSDILRHLARARLDDLARKFDPGPPLLGSDEQVAEALARHAGDRLLEMLTEIEPTELEAVCEATGYDAPTLARLCAPPRTRGDCESGLRPCPYSTCRHHVSGGPEPICALDVADEGGVIQDVIADAMGISRQRVQQIEQEAFESIRRTARRADLARLPSALHEALMASEVDRTPETGRVPALRIGLLRVAVDG